MLHTPGPIWRGGTKKEPELLRCCYQNCLNLAEELGCKTVSFPSISTGIYHFPLEQAAQIAVSAILRFLETSQTVEQVRMVCFDGRTKAAYEESLKKAQGE